MPAAHDHGHRQQRVDQGAQRQAPVDERQHGDHADDQQHRADRTGNHPTEEVAHRGDVAIDTLDQLAGRVAPMELVVEPQHVPGQVQPDLVRGSPRRDGGEPRHDHRDGLRGEGDDQEDQRQPGDLGGGGAGRGVVDDASDDQRAGERQRRAHAQEHAERAPTRRIGAEQGEQGAPVRRRRRGHVSSLPQQVSRSTVNFRGDQRVTNTAKSVSTGRSVRSPVAASSRNAPSASRPIAADPSGATAPSCASAVRSTSGPTNRLRGVLPAAGPFGVGDRAPVDRSAGDVPRIEGLDAGAVGGVPQRLLDIEAAHEHASVGRRDRAEAGRLDTIIGHDSAITIDDHHARHHRRSPAACGRPAQSPR